MEPLLTVFTPTYNRAHLLERCYESLKAQTSTQFIWLIIDDGSTDHTQQLVEGWIEEKQLAIQYHYQANQGMHGAHNTAYSLINTVLNLCIDSDDAMPRDGVEKIITFWNQHGSGDYAGIIALDVDKEEKIIGSSLPCQKAITLMGFYTQGGTGDKKQIYRTEVIKKYLPYPVFENEKYIGLNYIYMMIDKDYPLLIMNEAVCIVEYQADGSTYNMIHQYRNNPKGFAALRKIGMQYKPGIKAQYRDAIHYVSSSIMIHNKKFILESPKKMLTVLAIPFGIVLYLYIMRTSKDTVV